VGKIIQSRGSIYVPFIDPPISSWKDCGKNKDKIVIGISELEGRGKNKDKDRVPNVSIHLPIRRWNDVERIKIRIQCKYSQSRAKRTTWKE
jgi:hypothetical protein